MNTYGSGRKRRRLERPRDARSELINQTEPFEAVASSKVCFSAFQEPSQQQHPFLRKMSPISPSRRRRRYRHLFNLENRRDDSTKKKLFPTPSHGVASDRQTTNSIQPTDERASCQCERVITPTKRRERGETERDRAAAAQHRRRRVHVDVGLRLRVGQLDVFIKMEQGVRAVCVREMESSCLR